MGDVTLEGLLSEGRTFPPSAEFVGQALVTDHGLHAAAAADPDGFWAAQAGELLSWNRVEPLQLSTRSGIGPAGDVAPGGSFVIAGAASLLLASRPDRVGTSTVAPRA